MLSSDIPPTGRLGEELDGALVQLSLGRRDTGRGGFQRGHVDAGVQLRKCFDLRNRRRGNACSSEATRSWSFSHEKSA
ncbi:hypothetical protein CVV72_05770 [Amycolatopsis sp. TNS106]|nr:hypothetical protein CVV72_05770 [Amycolatopsis sp. TNS106]